MTTPTLTVKRGWPRPPPRPNPCRPDTGGLRPPASPPPRPAAGWRWSRFGPACHPAADTSRSIRRVQEACGCRRPPPSAAKDWQNPIRERHPITPCSDAQPASASVFKCGGLCSQNRHYPTPGRADVARQAPLARPTIGVTCLAGLSARPVRHPAAFTAASMPPPRNVLYLKRDSPSPESSRRCRARVLQRPAAGAMHLVACSLRRAGDVQRSAL